jgi:hypothetical protein
VKSEVSVFTPRENTNGRPYEERLSAEVLSTRYKDATLWVTDRDLSKTTGYRGLSEAIISKAATQPGIPVCKYARGTADDDVFERQRSWGDAQIVLKASKIPELAAKIALLAKGFSLISKKLNRLLRANAAGHGLHTPAEMMAHILDHPEAADRIALYASGDQKMISEILPFAGGQRKQEFQKRLPSVLGYWLYDSILRFPGVLLNAVATASYLDIPETHLRNRDVQKVFKLALYRGPFEDRSEPHWWRQALDEIVGKAKSGNELLAQKLNRRVPHYLDSQTGKRAGYYCMIKRVPVSKDNSVGNISWFPPGADLARVRKDMYEQLGPWLGLF